MRFGFVIIAIVVAVLGYGIMWSLSAQRLQATLDRSFDDARLGPHLQIDTDSSDVAGFPYRLTAILNGVRIQDGYGRIVARAERVEAISHLWTPGHWVITAQNVVFTLPVIGEIREGEMAASYRRQSSGNTGIFVSSGSVRDSQWDGGTKLSDWSIAVGLPGPDSRAEGALYEDVAARLKILLSLGGARVVAEGNMTGAPLLGTDRDALKAWQEAGGLLDLSALSVNLDGARITGNASLSLDADLTALGSLALSSAKAGDLSKLFAAAGLPKDVPDSGAVILQGGRASFENVILGPLRPLPRYR